MAHLGALDKAVQWINNAGKLHKEGKYQESLSACTQATIQLGNAKKLGQKDGRIDFIQGLVKYEQALNEIKSKNIQLIDTPYTAVMGSGLPQQNSAPINLAGKVLQIEKSYSQMKLLQESEQSIEQVKRFTRTVEDVKQQAIDENNGEVEQRMGVISAEMSKLITSMSESLNATKLFEDAKRLYSQSFNLLNQRRYPEALTVWEQSHLRAIESEKLARKYRLSGIENITQLKTQLENLKESIEFNARK